VVQVPAGEADPDREVDHDAEQEEAGVQEAGLVGGFGQLRGVPLLGPVEVDGLEVQQDRDGEDRHQDRVVGEQLGDATDHDAPAGPRQVVDDNKEQGADRQRQHRHVTRQVGQPELMPRAEGVAPLFGAPMPAAAHGRHRDGERQTDDAHDQPDFKQARANGGQVP
jgi:hypothetical protein